MPRSSHGVAALQTVAPRLLRARMARAATPAFSLSRTRPLQIGDIRSREMQLFRAGLFQQAARPARPTTANAPGMPARPFVRTCYRQRRVQIAVWHKSDIPNCYIERYFNIKISYLAYSRIIVQGFIQQKV